MRLRAAGGNELLQDAASPLGQGPDANGEKNSAARAALRPTRRRESRSRISSHREHQLSADGLALDAAAARHDRALLSGLVPDDADRSAAFHGVELFDLRLLSFGAARALS